MAFNEIKVISVVIQYNTLITKTAKETLKKEEVQIYSIH